MNTASAFFTEAEKNRIAETTRAAECGTIGEVAVMVVDSSDQYAEAEILGSIFMASLAALAIAVSLLHSSLWFYLSLSIIFFFPGRILLRHVQFLKRSLIGVGRMEAAVRQRALRAFYEKGLYKTRANTGVLFFLSLLEHKVWVLADKGIYEKIDQQTLNTFALGVSRGIKEGRACDALCQAISNTGEILTKHFPLAPGDTNELPDQVITE